MGSSCCGSLSDDSSFSTKVSQAHLLRNRRQSAAVAASLKVLGQASAAATGRHDTVTTMASLSTTATHNPNPRDNDLQSPSTTTAGNDEASFTHQDQTAISNSTTTAGAGGGMATEGSASRWPAVRLAPSYCDEMRSFQTVSTTATNSTGSPTTNVQQQQQSLSVSQKVFNPLSLGRVDSDTKMFEAAVENAPAALAPHSTVLGVLSFGTPSSSQVASTPGEFSTTVARPSTSTTTSNNIPPNRSGGERAARSAAVAVGEEVSGVQRQRSTQSLWGRSSATEIGSAELVGNMSDAFSDGRASTATRGPCRAPSTGELQTTGSNSRRVTTAIPSSHRTFAQSQSVASQVVSRHECANDYSI